MISPRPSSPPLRSPEQRRGAPGTSRAETRPLHLGTRVSALATTQSGIMTGLVVAHLGREV